VTPVLQPAEPPEVPLELAALYRAHVDRVARWVARLVGPSPLVDDLVHDVFLRVQRLLPSFRGDAKVTTWLYRITENVVRNHRRKERLRRLLGVPALSVELSTTAPPLEALERHEASRLVYRILDTLRERDRNLLILFELEQLSGEEIAELTGMTCNAVWIGLHRARGKFLHQLEKLDRRENLGWARPVLSTELKR